MIPERLDPSTTEDVAERALHLERYRWAAARLPAGSGARVLDAACGVGYGSAILAEASDRLVLGVDRDPAAIALARSRHEGDRVRFEQVSDLLHLGEDPAACDARRHDAVVCLETLEHLERPLGFLRRAHALLAPGGQLVVSAPVREHPGDNPHHLHCFTPVSLRLVVEEGFDVEDELVQAGGAYLTLLCRRRDEPCLAWREVATGEPRATVVLVTWNSSPQVLELVRALRGFTRRPYELLVVDNASTDGVVSALRLFRGEPGVRLVENPENRRLAAATNQAIALTRTEYLAYLCASHAMVTEEGWLERLVAWADEHPSAPLIGDVWAPGFPLASARYRPGWTPERHSGPLLHVQGGAFVARRSLFEELGGFDEQDHPHGGMDVELSYRLLSYGRELGACPLVRCPPSPELPTLEDGALVVHPAPPALRATVLSRLPGRPAPLERAHPLAQGWRVVNGQALALPGGVRIRSDSPNAGLLATRCYRDLRFRAKVRYDGVLQVKVRIASDDDPGADGYHVLLGPGTNYLARAGHVLAWFAAPGPVTDLELQARGPRLRLSLDGRLVADVQDERLSEGPVLVGANLGQAEFTELSLEDLGGSTEHDASPPPKAIVFCERLDNESFCAAVVRELGRHYDVRPCGPGWPQERLEEVDATGARFYLELDAASGSFVRPNGLERLPCPKFAWLIDTHKKASFHQAIAREVDLTFFAHKAWGHVFDRPCAWLPLHADQELWHPQERPRDLDVVFVGSQPWRAEVLGRIAARHGLRVQVCTTTGPREKSEVAALYARAKVVFNRHVTNDLNFRVFEALSCGRVLVTDAQPNGQYELFEDGRHLVYYKDDADLERQVLRLLGDEDLRAQIERDAAALATEQHTTRARVQQLVHGIEEHLAARERKRAPRVEVAEAPVTAAQDRPVALESLPRGRWLVIADEEPEAVLLESWAERVGHALRGLGQDVTVARERRGRLRSRAPGLLEIERGPLPQALTVSNRMLAGAGPFERRLAQALGSGATSLDAIVAEGPLGALVGPSLARRLDVPLVFLLRDCEVARRGNHLTREQVYLAALEEWACKRAALVLAPSPEVADAARQHYKVSQPGLLPVPASWTRAPASPERLLHRLGLDRVPTLVLGAELCEATRLRVLTTDVGRPLLLAGQGLWFGAPDRAPVCLSPSDVRGPALGALLAASDTILVADRGCERRSDAAALGRGVALLDPERLAGSGDGGDWLKTPLAPMVPDTSLRALASRFLGRAPVFASGASSVRSSQGDDRTFADRILAGATAGGAP